MSTFFRPFINLLLFRGQAQDVPASTHLLTVTAIAAVLADTLGSPGVAGIGTTFMIAAAQVVVLGLMLKLVFAMHRKPERWLQATTALLGCIALLNFARVPFSGGLEVSSKGMVANNAMLVVALLGLWYFVIQVRVLKEALDIGMGRAILLSVLLTYGILLIVMSLFGHLLPTAEMPVDMPSSLSGGLSGDFPVPAPQATGALDH